MFVKKPKLEKQFSLQVAMDASHGIFPDFYICYYCGSNFFAGFIWTGSIYGRTAYKRNWHPKSIGCLCFKYHNTIVERFCKTCLHCHTCRNTCCLLGHEYMDTEFRLPHWYKMVDVCCSRSICFADCVGNNKFPGYKSSSSEPGEEFKNRIKKVNGQWWIVNERFK